MNRQDMLDLFERLLKEKNPCRIEVIETCGEQEIHVKENGEDYAVIPLDLGQYVLKLAKKAPWPRGPRTKPTNIWRKDWPVLRWARRRKRELEDGGLSATEALAQAAKEASHRSERSAAWIKDRMQRKR